MPKLGDNYLFINALRELLGLDSIAESKLRGRKARPEHVPIGDPCIKCNLPAICHRQRAPRDRVRKRLEHLRE